MGASEKTFPEEGQTCVSGAVVAAAAASSSDPEDGSGPNWRRREEFVPQVALEVISFSQRVIRRGKRRPTFFTLAANNQGWLRAQKLELALKFIWRKVIDDPNAFPPESWQLFLPSNLIALGEKRHPVCVGMTWRRLLAAGTMPQWRRRLEETNREASQLELEYGGGVEQVALRAKVNHEAKNRLILSDCSNVFSVVKQTAALAEAAICVPALAPLVAKYHGERSASVFFQMEPGERRIIDCSSEIQRGDAMGPASFCAPLLPVLF